MNDLESELLYLYKSEIGIVLCIFYVHNISKKKS